MIEPVPAAARERALAFLDEDYSSAYQPQDRTDILLWSHVSEEPLAVGRIQSRDGRLIHLLMPRLAPAAPRGLGFDVLEAMVATAHQIEGAQFAQALVPVEEQQWLDALVDLGFRSVATILVLAAIPEPSIEDSSLQFLPLANSDRARLAEVVQQTWEDSLDCEELEDTRTIDAVLADYERRCLGDLRHWYVVRQQDDDVGCLLMDAAEESAPLEIVYWGVLPAFRGCGIGEQVLRFAREIGAKQRSMITAVVDSENWPAINAYNQARFSTVDHQKLFIIEL